VSLPDGSMQQAARSHGIPLFRYTTFQNRPPSLAPPPGGRVLCVHTPPRDGIMMQGSVPPSSGHGSSSSTPPSSVFHVPSRPDVRCQACPSTKEQEFLRDPYVKEGLEIGEYRCVHPLCKSKGTKSVEQMRRHIKESKTHRTDPEEEKKKKAEEKKKKAPQTFNAARSASSSMQPAGGLPVSG
jgi:hypothetical protein